MHIFKRELRVSLKSFILWNIGLFVLVFVGMAKFTGLQEGGEAVSQMLSAFPRLIQAMLGMVGIDMTSLPGYYAVIMYYALICISIYAVSLGANAAGREAVDKTYEFLFTKPCSRSKILGLKLTSGLIYLIGFCVLSYIYSIAAMRAFKLGSGIDRDILMFTLSLLIIGLLFYSLSAMLVAFIKRTEKGFLYGNLIFVSTFIIGMLYDMLEDARALRLFTPLRYFTAQEVLHGELNTAYIVVSAVLTAGFTILAFSGFRKKDLHSGI